MATAHHLLPAVAMEAFVGPPVGARRMPGAAPSAAATWLLPRGAAAFFGRPVLVATARPCCPQPSVARRQTRKMVAEGAVTPPPAADGVCDTEVLLYDTTLRDGTQQEGISLSVMDKLRVVERLDGFGVDYIEGTRGDGGRGIVRVDDFEQSAEAWW